MSVRVLWFLMAVFFLVLGWSAYQPYDLATWVLEALPAIVGVVILLATYRRFKLTGLLYLLIFLHAITHVCNIKKSYIK